MDLPISYDEALEEWDRFEQYLIQARYAIRNPKNGLPTEDDFPQVMRRVSSQFAHPEVAKALLLGRIITATPFLMNGGNQYTSRKGFYSCYPLGDVDDSTSSIFDMERDLVTIFQHAGGGGSMSVNCGRAVPLLIMGRGLLPARSLLPRVFRIFPPGSVRAGKGGEP